MYKNKYKIILIITVLLLCLNLFSQQTNDSAWTTQYPVNVEIHKLQEVVVSGYTSRLQGENVANVEKLSLRQMHVSGVSLGEKLATVAGIDNYSTGAGIGKPVIRGLSGNRIAVFSQGVRIENQQWGDEHGLGLDDNGYEQVEIIKGPASLLYGSDALGGVLFFADERYAAGNSVEAALNSEFHTNTLGLCNTGALKFSKNRFHFNIFGAYTTHQDYRDGGNNFVPNSRFNTSDVKTSLAYTSSTFSTSLKYNYLNEKYGLTETGEMENDYQNGRKTESPYQNLNTHLLGWENTVYFENSAKIKLDFGYVFNRRQELEDESAALDMNLNTFSYNVKWYSPRWKNWELTAGSQGLRQTNANCGEETLIPDAATADIGAFAMTNFYYGEKSFWQAGIRFDNRNIKTADAWRGAYLQKNYFAFNFSTGIFQTLAKNLSLRSNFSTGFRAPNMFELLSDGIHEGTNRYEIGNQELKTENSYQIDASLNFKSFHFEAFASPYFNCIRHFIFLQPTGETIDDVPVYNYLQTNAFLYGGEAGAHFHPHPLDWLHIEVSYANTIGQSVDNQHLPLMPSQKLKANISAVFINKKILEKYSFYLQNLYSFIQNSVAEYETATPAYDLLNAGINLEFRFGKQYLLLNIAANNLLNVKYFDHLSRYKTEGIYNMGRNVAVKVSLPINIAF